MNQHGKRERLPSADALQLAAEAIEAWWSAAYLRPDDAVLPGRFATEACASLPCLTIEAASRSEDVLAAVALQRLRLHQDQGVPEWTWHSGR